MPLRLFQRGGVWYVRGTAGPRGRRQSVYETTGTADAERAESYRARREAELWDRGHFGSQATVTFAEAALSYIEFRNPSAADEARLQRLVAHFGPGKLLCDSGQEAADEAVHAICRPDAAPATKIRSVICPLSAVMTHAARRGWCAPPLFDRPEVPAGRTAFLAPARALELMAAAAPHLSLMIAFFLGTGARVSEGLEVDLDRGDLDLAAGTCILRTTKNGADRIVILPPSLVAALANAAPKDGRLLRRPDGKPYVDKERLEGGQFKTAWRTACASIGLGKWREVEGETDAKGEPLRRFVPAITPHGLRHTWATWYYAATRDPMRVKAAGGWRSLDMVERYAHLMPSEAVPEIVKVWGVSHPDDFPAAVAGRAKYVQGPAVNQKRRAKSKQ